jgi:hypothetical protein
VEMEILTIDFITKLPRTMKHHDSIMVVVDKLTNVEHFIPVKLTHKSTNIAKIYMKEIVRPQGVHKAITSNRDPRLTSNSWKWLFKNFVINIKFSTTYHLKLDGKTKRVNEKIEDMLRMYVMDNPSRWEYYLHLEDFSYNNGYHESFTMSPFEALDGRK